MGDALVRLSRFGRLLGPGFAMRLAIYGEQAVLEEPHHAGPLPHVQATLCLLATIGLNGRRLTGQHLEAIEWRLIPTRPAYASDLEKIVGAPLCFGATHNALVFPSRCLHLPIGTSDADRCSAFERQAQVLLEQLDADAVFTSNVEGLLAVGLASDTAETVAARLGLSPRTLARRLRAEGTTFQRIRTDIRRRMAESYLRLTDMSATDIALSLGFSDETAFSRAFRRWTGLPPVRYRARARGSRPKRRVRRP